MRQLEVLDLAAHGPRCSEIARELFVSVDTVKTHLRDLSQAWRVHGRAELVGEGFRRGWLVALPADPVELTYRQAEPLCLMSNGASHREVADFLGLAGKSLYQHLNAAVKRLQARNIVHAVALWEAHGRVQESTTVPGQADFTSGEVDVIRHIATGRPLAGLVCDSGRSRSYVDACAVRVRTKTGVRDNVALVGWAYRNSVLTPAGTRTKVALEADVVQVLDLAARGRGVAAIARDLELSEHRVWALLGVAREKLAATSRLQLVVAAYETGVLKPEAASTRQPFGR